jgi:hypothetical protein
VRVSEVIERERPRLCHVLREDRELADVIPAARRQRAIQDCTAREISVGRGSWDPPRSLGPAALGLLLLDGLLIRRVGFDERFGSELLGETDLLRPWHGEPSTLQLTSAWLVAAPLRVAVLDEEFVQCLGSYPELAVCLVARAIQRSRNLAIHMAIIHQARVDARLHMLLWHLAARWGRVRSDGTVLPLRLTHTLLAELVAARRPTVTSALSELTRRGLVRAAGDEWVLSGEPPGALRDLAGLGPTTGPY